MNFSNIRNKFTDGVKKRLKHKKVKPAKKNREKTWIEKFHARYVRDTLWVPAILAVLINFAIESMARQSLGGGFGYLAGSPLVFLYNALIIFATMSLGLLFRRKVLIYLFISIVWLGLGITNGIILSKRMTPFTTKDMANIEDGLTIATNYLSTTMLVVVGVIFAVAVAGVVLFWFKGPKSGSLNYRKIVALVLAIGLGTSGATGIATRTGLVDTYFGNLAYAYRDNGFPYCFISTWLNTGINKPLDYTPTAARNLFTEEELGDDGVMDLEIGDDGIKHANIIFLQLESFADPQWFTKVSFSEDPIPNFRSLAGKYSTGLLTVPSVGAGTANTEFEALCGISIKSFGPGEYPYKSILLKEPVESVAVDLKSIGYTAHAIHNHRGVFYGRNKVFENMGFDTFTSLEYMNNVIKTPKNWARDGVLTDYIMAALQSSEKEDFIYTISVEGHGAYPSEEVLANPEIKVLDAPNDELRWQYEYYANLLKSMDNFIVELTEALKDYDERVILVMYGDHLPAIDMTEEELTTGNLYQTRYVIWSNYWMPKKEQDLSVYQLSAEVLDRLNIHVGTMIEYHQNHQDSETYIEGMEFLGYDMLYGKHYIYGGYNPFTATGIQMGINPVKINEVVQVGGDYYIKGENFTQYSKISLDGEILKTIYLGPTVLGLLEGIDPDDVVNMRVSQVEKNKEILSTTE